MRRIQPDRQQQRPHFALEKSLDPAVLRQVALAIGQDSDADLGQRRYQFVVVQRVLRVHQCVRFQADLAANEFGQRIGFRHRIRGAGAQHGANLKELVQVGRHDAQIAQAFQQRHIGALGPIQHAGVEREQA